MAAKKCHFKLCPNKPTGTIIFRQQRVPVCDDHKKVK